MYKIIKDRRTSGTVIGSPLVLSTPCRQTSRSFMTDSGTLGTVSTRCHFMLKVCLPTVCYIAAFFCALNTLFAAAADEDVSLNVVMGAAMGLWLLGNLFRRASPFLWAESGRLSFSQVTAIDSTLVPRTLRGRLATYTLLADVGALPLCLAFSVFREVSWFSYLGLAYLPPYVTPGEDGGGVDIGTVYVLLVTLLVLPLTVGGVALLLFRCMPREQQERCASEGRRWYSPAALLALAVALSVVPIMMVISTPLSCRSGAMRFSAGIACRSPAHRRRIMLALCAIGVWNACLELLLGSTRLLAFDGTSRTTSEWHNDAFTLEVRLLLRWLTVLTATLSGDPFRCLVLAGVATIALYRLQTSLASSIAVLHHWERGVTAMVLVSSVVCAVVQLLGVGRAYGLTVWLVSWAVTMNTFVVMHAMRWGATLFEAKDVGDIELSLV